MISWHVRQGDSHRVLKKLVKDPKERRRYRLIVTSPPYYGHRHYGENNGEIGQEKTDKQFIESLVDIFVSARELLTDDGSLWIVVGDTRKKMGKLMIPHRLALRLVEEGYAFREDIIWYKKNNVSSSSTENLSQSYEFILFLSKKEKSFTNMDMIRIRGNEAREGRNKTPSAHLMQKEPLKPDKEMIAKITETIRNSRADTPFEELPTTSEISWAFGYDPEKYCPTCYRKFKRHATRKRIGDHRHYPIFAVCNPAGKNPGNIWEISTKAHYGNEHFAIFPEDLVARIVNFASEKGDWVLDTFAGRGTTGIVCALTGRNFTGIELYPENIETIKKNIRDALEGKYDRKLAEAVAKEMEITKPRNGSVISLEAYLLAHP
jgi:DNA modification methylase